MFGPAAYVNSHKSTTIQKNSRPRAIYNVIMKSPYESTTIVYFRACAGLFRCKIPYDFENVRVYLAISDEKSLYGSSTFEKFSRLRRAIFNLIR